MSRRTVALAAAGIVAVAVAIVIVVTGRTHASPQRSAVARYVKSVDAVQQELRASLTAAGVAYRDLTLGKPMSAARRRELAAAEATLREIGKRLAALPAPAPARRLKLLLVDLAQRQAAVAHEVNDVASFMPRYLVLLRKTRSATTQLGRSVAAVPAVKARRVHGTKAQIATARKAQLADVARAAAQQADAVDVYVTSVDAIHASSTSLHAPPVLRPVYRAEVKALADSVAAGRALSAALRSAKRADVAARSRAFADATRSAAAVSVQRAEISAIRAYNARVRSIGTLQGKIRLEIGRIDTATS